MTKAIKISSVIALILLLVGTLFKTRHWPGANIMEIAGAAAAIVLFILILASVPVRLKTIYEKISVFVASLTLIVGFLAFVFKLMHLAGAAWLIGIADTGVMLTAIFFLADGLMEKDQVRSGLKIIASFLALFLLLVIVLTA